MNQDLHNSVDSGQMTSFKASWIGSALFPIQPGIHCLFDITLYNQIGLKTSGERRGSVVECFTRDRGTAGLSLTGTTVLCP